MKKKIKFGGLFLVVFVAFIAMLILPNQLVEVNAEEDITFTNFTDGYLDLKLGETKSFTIEGDKYQLRGCSANGENAIKTNFNKDNNTCEVTGNTYGSLDFSVEYIYTTDEDQEYPNVMMRTVTALVDLDEYVTKVMDLVPNEFTEPVDLYNQKLRDKLPNGFNLLHDESTCHQTTSGKVCTLTVDYTYYGTVQKNIKKTKEITFIGKKVPQIYASNVDVGQTINLGFEKPDEIDFDNYFLVSKDATIASISSVGKITGNMPGQVEIRMYDKTTLNYSTAYINVGAPSMSTQEFVNYFNQNRNIELDFSTDFISTSRINDQVEVNYEHTVGAYLAEYFRKVSSSHQYILVKYDQTTCNGSTCKVKYQINNQDYETGDLTIDVSGIRVVDPGYDFAKGSMYNLKQSYMVQVLNNEEYTISVDPEYFSYNPEADTYTVLKLGTTEITYLTNSGKMATLRVEIKYDQNDMNEINSTVWNLNGVNLPYKSTDFNNNLNLLSSIVKNKVLSNIDETNTAKNYADIKVTCLFSGSCQVRSNKFGMNKNINITYDDLSTDNSIQQLKEIDSQIKSSYKLSFEDTITLENRYSNEVDFYNHLIDETNISSLQGGLIAIKSVRTSFSDMTNYLRGSATYEVTVKLNNENMFSKEVLVMSDHILDSTGLDSHEETDRYYFIKNKILPIMGKDAEVTRIEDNYYRIDRKFNILLDQKEELPIESIQLKETIAELNVGDTYKVKYKVYPNMANSGQISYKSKNTKVATVNEDGLITAVSNGITLIELKFGNSTQTVTVLVGDDFEQTLNQIVDKLNSHVIVDYSNLTNQKLEDAIQNSMWDDIYSNNKGIDNLQSRVTKENGKYYIQLYKYLSYIDGQIIYSKKKPITYELKGIRVKDGKINLTKGDTYNTELYFSEGDYKNLIIEVSNKEVISVDEKGIITALNPGTSYINIYDKYNQYYNNIQVFVDRETYVNQLIDSVKSSPIILHGKNNYYACDNCLDTEEIKIQNQFNQEIYNQTELGSYYNMNTRCDISNNTCEVRFYEWDYQTGTEHVFRTETFTYEKRGIFFDQKETSIDINNYFLPSYKVYPEGSSISMESLDTNKCVIENDQIKGISKGICPVKFTSGDEVGYHFVIVDGAGIISDIQSGLNNAPMTINLKSPKYNPSLIEGKEYDEQAVYKSIYNAQIIKVLKDYIQLPSDINYNIWYDIDLNEMVMNDSVNVKLNLNYYYENSTEQIFYDYNFPSDSLTHTFNFTYSEVPEEIANMSDALLESVKKQYNLSLMQVMQYQASNASSADVFKYSSLESDIKSVCTDCTYEVDPTFGGGMGDEGFFQMTYPIVIFKDSYPVTSLMVDFIVRFNVTLDSELTSEDEMIEIIKDEVREAYKEMKGLQPSVRKFKRKSNALNLQPMAEEEIEVDVTREYDDDGSSYYSIRVEELEFKAVVGTNLSENVTVEYTQSPIKDFKLSTSVVHLTPDTSKTINPLFEAEGEYDNTVIWSSSDESVATVDASGKVTAVGLGTATITARASNNMIAECSVNVESFLKGDVTKDSRVDLLDVMLALRASLDLVTVDDDVIMRGDINGVDGIDLADVMYILRIALNLTD